MSDSAPPFHLSSSPSIPLALWPPFLIHCQMFSGLLNHVLFFSLPVFPELFCCLLSVSMRPGSEQLIGVRTFCGTDNLMNFFLFYEAFSETSSLTNDYSVQRKESKIRAREQKVEQEWNRDGARKGLCDSHFKFFRLDEDLRRAENDFHRGIKRPLAVWGVKA